MYKSLINTCAIIACLMLFWGDAFAQLPGPGAQKDMERIKELERETVLEQDTVIILDTIVVFDPETSVETVMVVENKFSIFEYCQQILGVSNPNDLLDGSDMMITNPETYEKMTIRWNADAGKIDTIQ